MVTTFTLSKNEVSELLYIVRSYRALRTEASYISSQMTQLSMRLSEVEAENDAIKAKEEELYESLQKKHGLDRNAVVEIVAKHAIQG